MKILFIIHSFLPHTFAGTEVYTYDLSRELAKRHKIGVFFRIKELKKEENSISAYSQDGLSLWSINNTLRFCESFKMTYDNPQIDKRFSALLDEIRPDIVHIQHLLFLSLGIVEEIKKRNIPIVFTLHDYWLLCPRGQLLKENLKNCIKPNKGECLECLKYQLAIKSRVMHFYYRLRGKIPRYILHLSKLIYLCSAGNIFKRSKQALILDERNERAKKVFNAVDIFLAPSVFLKDKFASCGFPLDRIKVLSCGIDRKLPEGRTKLSSRKLRLGFIGTILPAKGVHILIQAFKELKNDDLELNIYGEEKIYTGYEGYLKQIKRLSSSRNIFFRGGFDNRMITSIMSEIDLLVVPSLWQENSPLVVREAFLARVPVLGSRTGGMPELVRDGINGMLFNPGDVRDLKEKLEYIIANKEILDKFKENIPYVKSIKENAAEIEAIYEGLIFEKSS